MERKTFLKTMGLASATVVGSSAITSTLKANENEHSSIEGQKKRSADNIKLGASLYSYQHALGMREMTVEDCMAELHSIGANSIRLLIEENMPDYPYPSEEWVEKWWGWLEKYQLEPSCMDSLMDDKWGYRHVPMTMQEQIDDIIVQLKLAKKLRFKGIRPTSVADNYNDLLMEVVPYAEEYDIIITPEVHNPILLKGPEVAGIMEVITKTNTKHLGFNLDFGVFSLAPGDVADPMEGDMIAPGGINETQDVIAFLPYTPWCHGKFHTINPQMEQTYKELINIFIEHGWNGYIDTEFEGQRQLLEQLIENDMIPIDEAEQVRRQHVIMRNLLGRS